MRILYLTQFFSFTRGGGPLIFYDLAKALSERGHSIYIICNVASETIESKNVKVITVKPSLNSLYELPPSLVHNLRFIANAVVSGSRVIREHKIDVIHSNSFTPVIAGSILSKLKSIPMIASIYDVFTNNDKSNWTNWAHFNNLPNYYSGIGRMYERFCLRMPVSLIHTISDTTRQDILLHIDNKPIRVVYPAIDDKLYQAIKPYYDDFILYIGRLVFYKNVDVLIRAYEEVVKKLPKAKLIIVGEGSMKEEWIKLARSIGVSKNVIFAGHLSHKQKIDLLTRCSALALPSVFEGFGLVILEAFAMGKPALVSNVHPFNEIIDQGIDGFLITHNDPHQWAGAVISVLADKQLCQKMGSCGAKKVRQRFNFNKYIESMESLYTEIIKNKATN